MAIPHNVGQQLTGGHGPQASCTMAWRCEVLAGATGIDDRSQQPQLPSRATATNKTKENMYLIHTIGDAISYELYITWAEFPLRFS